MTDKITNIEELYELINPELLTTEQNCYEMISKVRLNKVILNNYIKNVIKRLAKLNNKKIFTQNSKYEVTYRDYYMADNKNEIESCADSLYDEIVDYHDGYYFEDFEELKE